MTGGKLDRCKHCGAAAELSYLPDPFEPGSAKPDKTMAKVSCRNGCTDGYQTTARAIAAWNASVDAGGKTYMVTVLPPWTPLEMFLRLLAVCLAALSAVAVNHALIGGAWFVDLALLAFGGVFGFAILPKEHAATATFTNKAQAAAWLWSRP